MTRSYYSHHRDRRRNDVQAIQKDFKQEDEEEEEENYVILFRTSFHNTVYDVLKDREGWRETDSEFDWDFNWAGVEWIRNNYDSIQFEVNILS